MIDMRAGPAALCRSLLPVLILSVGSLAAADWDDPVQATLEPPWQAGMVRREIVSFIAHPGEANASARLIAPPAAILSVRQAAWVGNVPRVWQVGSDLRADGARLEALPAAGIPAFDAGSSKGPRPLFKATGWGPRTRIALPADDVHWADDPWTQTLARPATFPEPELRCLGAANNDDQLSQVEVVYRTAAPWTGWRPEAVGARVAPALMAKLAARQPVRLTFFGDSITEGHGASARGGQAPFAPGRPAWPALTGAALARAYGYADPASVVVDNRAHAGHTIGDLQAPGIAEAKLETADLVVIAYGMNDAGNGLRGRGTDWVARFLLLLRERTAVIRKQRPDLPIVVVAPMLGNPEWARTGEPFFSALEQALPPAIAGDGHVAMLDITRLWKDVLAAKGWTPESQRQGRPLCGWYDLAANRLNHPNDAGHLLYAQAMLGLIGVPAVTSPASGTQP